VSDLSPDLIEPGTCGHVITFTSVAVYCERDPGHDGPHGQRLHARARRSGLGTMDERRVYPVLEWDDERPAATVGDVLGLIIERRTP